MPSHHNEKSNIDSEEDTIISNSDSNDTNSDQYSKKMLKMSDFDNIVTHGIPDEYCYESHDSNHSCE